MKEMWDKRYSEKEQLRYGTGGPRNIDMLYSRDELRADFEPLDIQTLTQTETELSEGAHHRGLASVIRLVARRPQAGDRLSWLDQMMMPSR